MILAALNRQYGRLARRGDVPAYGYSHERVGYVLVIDTTGRLVDVQTNLTYSAQKPRPRAISVPRPEKRTSGVKPNFLWDKTSYVLGVTDKMTTRTEQEHAAFKDFHEATLHDVDDEGLTALRHFLQNWNPEQFSSSPLSDEMLDSNLVFRLDGEQKYLHERGAALALWTELLSADTTSAPCLITGDESSIARLHSAIKGVDGAQSSGASIVSFNLDAFTSYGKTQGENSPISERAAFGYTTALNHLLRRDEHNRQRLRIGDTTTVFWAEAGSESSAQAAENLFAALAEPPTDEQEGENLRSLLEQIAKGRPLLEVVPDLQETTRFFVLGLAPNAARLSIRFWQAGTLEEFAHRFAEHYADLYLEPVPWKTPPAVWRLLYEIAAQRKPENIPPQIAGEFMRAILTGRRYPRSLLTSIIMRIRADGEINGLRAAICKACLTRDFRKGGRIGKEVPVSLDKEDMNPGYRLGRLFAVLESAQRGALGRQINATIRDRYYGSASATPASVFPVLLRNVNHHLSKLRKDGRGGLAYALERDMGEILDGFDAIFPRSLRIEEQGRFAIGYYHQRFTREAEAPGTDPNQGNIIEEGE